MTIPTRKDWQAFKKLYGVADKAAKNVSVGPDLDKMITAFNRLPANPTLLEINSYLDVVRQAAAEIKAWTDGLNYVNPQG